MLIQSSWCRVPGLFFLILGIGGLSFSHLSSADDQSTGLTSPTMVDSSTQTDSEMSIDEVCTPIFNLREPANSLRFERVRSTCELAHALVSQYSLLEQKEKRIRNPDGSPFNSKKHLGNCVQREASSEDPSDLHFMDRLRQCVAGFQDTHLSVNARNPIPPVFTGIQIANIQGKYLIIGKVPELIGYLKSSASTLSGAEARPTAHYDEVLAIGNEVVEIDGKSPAELSAHYAQFISSSTPEGAKSRADTAIFQRNFDYPTKNSVDLKIKSLKKVFHVRLPWWSSKEAHQRQDASEYFRSLSIPLTDRVKMVHVDEKVNHWADVKLGYQGYTDEDSILSLDPFSSLITYTRKTGEVAARMGKAAYSGYGFCYLQLNTFATPRLYTGATSVGFLEGIRSFIRSCKDQSLDLVFDLRYNHGGNGSYPAQILSMLAPENATYAGKVVAFRNTSANHRMLSSVVNHPELNSGDLDDFHSRQFEQFEAARVNGATMTQVIPWENITPDPRIGGYSGKIVALITPHCVSACDGMAALLKRNKRAILIGSQTNGTGAGFVGSKTIDSEFQDSNNEFTLRVPNYLFGYSDEPLFPELQTLDFAANEDRFFTENRPTIADVPFQLNAADIKGKRSGWLEAALKALR